MALCLACTIRLEGSLKLAALAEGDVDTPRYMARKHDWIRSTVREALAHYGVVSQRCLD